MKQKEKTKEEIAAHEHAKMLKRKFKSLSVKVKNSILTIGLHAVELQLEFLKANPGTKVPEPLLSYGENIQAFEAGINMYKELLSEAL